MKLCICLEVVLSCLIEAPRGYFYRHTDIFTERQEDRHTDNIQADIQIELETFIQTF